MIERYWEVVESNFVDSIAFTTKAAAIYNATKVMTHDSRRQIWAVTIVTLGFGWTLMRRVRLTHWE